MKLPLQSTAYALPARGVENEAREASDAQGREERRTDASRERTCEWEGYDLDILIGLLDS